MEYEFLKYPKTIVILSNEIKRITNDYNARKIGNEELKEIILWYANKCGEMMFQGQSYNPTLKKNIGKRRIKLLEKILEGYQLTLFEGVK